MTYRSIHDLRDNRLYKRNIFERGILKDVRFCGADGFKDLFKGSQVLRVS
ncbi:MAG: hypothetical protein ACW99Q_04965 [Candidatus Kariarchaeaceae archaeon]|jgi:hypothetical protein